MGKRSKKTRFKPRFFVFLAILALLVIAVIYFGIYKNNNISKTNPNNPTSQSQESTVETPSEVVPEDITIKMTVIGDIMCHNTQYNDAYNSSSKKYDFSYVFEDIKDKLSQADITVGNLETTFAPLSISFNK